MFQLYSNFFIQTHLIYFPSKPSVATDYAQDMSCIHIFQYLFLNEKNTNKKKENITLFQICILITPLVSSNSSYTSNMSLFFWS